MSLKQRSSLRLVWVVLCGLTLAGAWLASGSVTSGLVGLVILLLALVKVWLILHHYMELSVMPRAWRLSFRAWLGGLFVALAGMYLWAGSWH